MLEIRRVPIGKIIPAPYNPRVDLRPGDPEYDRLRRGMDEFGLVEPLVWNRRTGHLVGGHQRLKVLAARGETRVDVSVVDLPLEREKALNLALNKLAGRWDGSKLASLLDELLAAPELDIGLAGFDLAEARAASAGLLDGLSGDRDPGPEGFDADRELEAARTAPAVTRPGEVVELGPHRLLCGDSTDPAQVRLLMGGRRAGLMATDPPYLVGYDGTNRPKGRKARAGQAAAPEDAPERPTWDDPEQAELYDRFVSAALAEALGGNPAVYCWHASRR